MIAHVVAMAEHNVIGSKNDLPWYLPADLKHFKEVTSGHTVVMGRTTFESIVNRLGKPLPNRHNVVLTRDHSFHPEGVAVIHDPQDIRSLADAVYVIGGAQVYAATIAIADTLYITEVRASIKGDTQYPTIDRNIWREISREQHASDEKNPYNYDFVVYKRY